MELWWLWIGYSLLPQRRQPGPRKRRCSSCSRLSLCGADSRNGNDGRRRRKDSQANQALRTMDGETKDRSKEANGLDPEMMLSRYRRERKYREEMLMKTRENGRERMQLATIYIFDRYAPRPLGCLDMVHRRAFRTSSPHRRPDGLAPARM